MSGMAAPAIFDRNRMRSSAKDDLDVLSAAARFETPFTISQVAAEAGSTYLYSNAQRLLRTLLHEGHLRLISPPHSKPLIYEWVDA